MATLQIKNKYQVSFIKLIKETKAEGGVPDVIQVNGKEGWDILNEIRLVGNKGFEVEGGEEYDPQFILKSSEEPIEKDKAQDLVTRWWKKEFKVFFKDVKERIEVVVVSSPAPKPTPPEPKMPPNTPVKEGEVDKPTDSGDNKESDD